MANLPRTALIAGGSSGIGLGIAHALAEQGASRLHLVARREERLKQAARQITERWPATQVFIHPCDLTDQAAVQALRDDVVAQHGAPEGLLHSAGAGELTTISEESVDNLHLHWNSTVVTAYHLVQAFFDDLVLQERAWVVIAGGSPLQRWPNPALSYVTTRRALSGFADALREDLHGSGVHVMFCEPPGISEGTSYFTDNTLSASRLPLASQGSKAGFLPADEVGRGIVRGMSRGHTYYTSPAIKFLGRLFSLPILRGLMARSFRDSALPPERGGPPSGHHRRLALARRRQLAQSDQESA